MKLRIQRADHADIAPLVRTFHYSGIIPKGKNVFFAGTVPIGTCELYAGAVYGWGVNPYQETFLTKLLNREVTRANCFELKRLVRTEPARPEYPLTAFLAGCHRLLKRDGIRYVVAFSDPAEGHTGGIYRAANFIFAGRTQSEIHCIDRDGKPVHRRLAYRHAKANGMTIGQARKMLGLTTVKTEPKDRWLLDLRLDLRLDPPKPVDVGARKKEER